MSRARDLADSADKDVTGTLTTDGLTVAGNVSVDGGTIKLDGNYPTGTANVALGNFALSSGSLSGGLNTAVGNGVLLANTSGANNSGFGTNSLITNSTGSSNTAAGYQALYANTTGTENSALGKSSLGSNTTGSNNTSIGHAAGFTNQTGGTNTYLGELAGYYATTSNNTMLGYGAGYQVTTGHSNTFVGKYTGNNSGYDFRTANNHIVLSDGGGTPRLYLTDSGDLVVPRVYNATTSNSANVQVDSVGIFRRSTSSRRYKNTITDATHGLTELLTLRPITYKSNSDGDTVFGGLIAEEVHDAGLTEFVSYNDDNEPDALAYGNMVSLCIKAIQELKTELDAAKARIATLEAE